MDIWTVTYAELLPVLELLGCWYIQGSEFCRRNLVKTWITLEEWVMYRSRNNIFFYMYESINLKKFFQEKSLIWSHALN